MARESEGDLRILSFRIMYVRLDLFGSVFMVSLEGRLRPMFRDGKKSVADVSSGIVVRMWNFSGSPVLLSQSHIGKQNYSL